MKVGQVARWAKNVRNAAVDHFFRRRGGGRGRRFAAELFAHGIRRPAFSIAFDTPWVVDLLTLAWRRHPPGMPLVIVDNSRSASARREHDRICRSRGVPYLGLPFNPEWSPNRSNGIAINWTWFNIVLQAPFELTGFIDHDCLPIRDFNLPSRIGDRSVYGLRGVSKTCPHAWNIWTGYCFIKPPAAIGRSIDFKHRIEYGLDTGGGNWPGFYRHLDLAEVGDAGDELVRIDLDDGGPPLECLIIDGAFLHFGGASYARRFREPQFQERLAAVIQQRHLS